MRKSTIQTLCGAAAIALMLGANIQPVAAGSADAEHADARCNPNCRSQKLKDARDFYPTAEQQIEQGAQVAGGQVRWNFTNKAPAPRTAPKPRTIQPTARSGYRWSGKSTSSFYRDKPPSPAGGKIRLRTKTVSK